MLEEWSRGARQCLPALGATTRRPAPSSHRRRLLTPRRAVARWEQTNSVPRSRLTALAKLFRTPADALLSVAGTEGEERKARVDASVREMFADQIVIDFGDQAFHSLPSC